MFGIYECRRYTCHESICKTREINKRRKRIQINLEFQNLDFIKIRTCNAQFYIYIAMYISCSPYLSLFLVCREKSKKEMLSVPTDTSKMRLILKVNWEIWFGSQWALCSGKLTYSPLRVKCDRYQGKVTQERLPW